MRRVRKYDGRKSDVYGRVGNAAEIQKKNNTKKYIKKSSREKIYKEI